METIYNLTPKFNPKTKTYTFVIQCPYCGIYNHETEPIVYLICKACGKVSRVHDSVITIMNQLKDQELQLKLQK